MLTSFIGIIVFPNRSLVSEDKFMNLANRLSAITQVASAYRYGIHLPAHLPLLPHTTVGGLVNLLPPRSRRWLPIVLTALVLVGFAPHQAAAQTDQTVSSNSPLIPDVDDNGPDLIGGQTFRLLFLTNAGINGESDAFGPYNTHVQTAANNGHLNIQGFSSQFHALVSVGNDMNNNARNNTATTGTGVPIYWLLGAKVADDYGNFYNGSWDSRVATNEHGRVITNPSLVWTGSKFNGTRAVDGSDLRTMGTSFPRIGLLNIAAVGPVGPIDGGPGAVRRKGLELPLYAMSPIIVVRPDLSNLVLSGDPPMYPLVFDPATTDYSVSVPYDTNSITLTPTFTNPTATIAVGTAAPITIVSGAASAAIPLSVGSTRVSIVLPATTANGDDFSRTYTITINLLPPPPAAAPTEGELLIDSLLVPDGMQVGSKLRLLFVDSGVTPRNANYSFYNTSVIRVARSGHADIRPFSDQFRALVSTHEVDARDNTATNHVKTPSDTDAPIYWVNGDKVADNYADFYDGSWDSRALRNSAGNTRSADSGVLTGSLANGVGQPRTRIRIGDRSTGFRVGQLNQGEGNEIDAGVRTDFRRPSRPLYGLSPVLNIIAIPDTSISNLVLSGNPPMYPMFDSDTTDYAVSVPNDTNSITLTPTFANPTATIAVGTTAPITIVSGAASAAIPLSVGNTSVSIVLPATVAGQDFSNTYTITINRLPSPPAAPTEGELLIDSLLVPDGIQVGSKIRLLFVGGSSTPVSADYRDYNDIVAAEAVMGHADIRPFSSQFRALVSTAQVDARDNTDTRSSGIGVPIYWVNGDKVADNYADFYDGSWISRALRNSAGNEIDTGTIVLTGSLQSGRGQPRTRIGDRSQGFRVGQLSQGEGNEIDAGVLTDDSVFRPLYGLSPVLTLVAGDSLISFQQAEYSIFEGTTGTITLVADPPPKVKTQIRLTTLSETAISDAEYQLSTTIITFAPNQSVASFEVSIIDDDILQVTNRQLRLSFELPDDADNATPGTVTEAVIIVKNDDVEISLTTPDTGNSLIVTEGSDPSATLQLNFVPSIDRVLSVNLLYTGDIGALTGELSSVVIMVPANTQTYDFDVDIEDNQIAAESTRIVTVQLEESELNYLVSDTDKTVEISVEDDDVARVSFSQSTGTVTEGDDIVFIIIQDLITDIETAVDIEFIPTGDFFKTTPMTTQVDFPADGVAMSTAKIVIETVNDKNVEADGSLRANIVRIDESPLQLGTPTESIVTILNDDVPAISFQQGAYTIFEGTTGTITLVAKPPPLVKIQIELTTRSGTTVSNDDYRLSTTIITFKSDQSTASFEVSIPARNGFQATQELILSFELLDTENSIPGTVSETVITVENDELRISLRAPGNTRICRPPPTPESTPNCRIVVTEGDGSGTLQLDASRLTARPLTVNLLYTADAGALDGGLPSDSTDSFTTVTVATETTTRHTFEVDITDDQIAAEFTRATHVVLQPGDGYTVDPDNTTVEVAVMDDDFAEVYFSQGAGSVTEGDDIVFIITKDLMTAIETLVEIGFESTGDFFTTTPMTTEVRFPAGGAVLNTAKITIPTVDDKDIEADGSLMAAIVIIPGSPLRPGGVGRPDERTVTILNDDVPAVISFERAEYAIFEGTTDTITLVAEPPPGIKIQIELTTLSETTISDDDYRLSTTIITFEPDQSTASFVVSIIDDNILQATRELHLSLESLDTENSTPGAVYKTIISVKDDAAPIAGLEVVGGDIRLEEGANVTLRVTLDRPFGEVTNIQIETEGTATTADYTITVNPVTLSIGSTSVETRLMIIPDDNDQEPDETIILTLDAVNNQIIDDEPGVQLTLTIGAKVLLFRMKVFLEGAQ